MTTMTDPHPQGGFKLSMLIYDSRYRSMTIQIVALIGFLTLIGWLINNTAQNLADLGKEPSFGFMTEGAGYDINQKLLDYNSTHTHAKAALLGLLNTLLVAVLGCITATVIGVLVGVARLSHNWIISRLMAFYVEMFRNVPVLLWIVLAMAIMIESFDPPKSFRPPRGGGEATASMLLGDSVAVSNQGIFIPRLVPSDLGLWILVVLALSLVAIRMIRKWADKRQEQTGDRPHTLWLNIGVFVVPSALAYFALTAISSSNQQAYIAVGVENPADFAAYIEEHGKFNYCHASGSAASLNGIRALTADEVNFGRKNFFSQSAARTGLLEGKCDVLVVDASGAEDIAAEVAESVRGGKPVAMFDAGFTEGRAIEVERPAVTTKGIAKFEGGTHMRNSLIALWLALSLYTAAFIAEIVRAGILAISKGQSEAAGALGLRPRRIMSLVVLPQALRVIIPPLISNYLNLTKNSSLAIAVGYMDLTGTLGGITLNQTGRELETLLLLMLIYLIISLTISALMNWYNNSVKLKER